MKIFRSKYTRETSTLLREMMPEEFRELPIVLNYGNGCNFRESKYGNKLILNHKEAVRRCSNKKEMFRYISDCSVEYIDIKMVEGFRNAVDKLLKKKELVGRKGNRIGIIKRIRELVDVYPDIDYVTVKEDKEKEFRVLMVLGEPFRIMEKINSNGDFMLKHANSTFRGRKISNFDFDIMEKIKCAVKKIGIDVCGVDVCLNRKGEYKILEINSGASLCKRSVRKFYKKLGELIKERKLFEGITDGKSQADLR